MTKVGENIKGGWDGDIEKCKSRYTLPFNLVPFALIYSSIRNTSDTHGVEYVKGV